MHDPTEGGILNGVHEMADASGLGVHVFEEKITVEPETAKICRFYEIDPLQLISSGALLIAADPQAVSKIISNLAAEHIYADVIGEFNPNPNKRILMHTDQSAEMCQDQPQTIFGWRCRVDPFLYPLSGSCNDQ